MKTIAVFCGSSSGNEELYAQQTYTLGTYLAHNNYSLVYGGASIGLMGAIADGVLDNGGKVTGIIPSFFTNKEIMHQHLTECIIVESMHERKMAMYKLSDGIIILPGGYGTMDEFFEILTWAQLGLHKKPIGLWNIQGFYHPLLTMIEKMAEKGFVQTHHVSLLCVHHDYEQLLAMMNVYSPPSLHQWVSETMI
jgi:uncharacterized protein (TIGR00730 family)